jgi:hypothetical protein
VVANDRDWVALFIVIENEEVVFVAVDVSVTDMRKFDEVPTWVGVPEMTPVVELRVNPWGRVPFAMENKLPPLPPVEDSDKLKVEL